MLFPEGLLIVKLKELESTGNGPYKNNSVEFGEQISSSHLKVTLLFSVTRCDGGCRGHGVS